MGKPNTRNAEWLRGQIQAINCLITSVRDTLNFNGYEDAAEELNKAQYPLNRASNILLPADAPAVQPEPSEAEIAAQAAGGGR